MSLVLFPDLTHAQAETICREHDLEVRQDGRGNLSLEPAKARESKIADARKRFGQPFSHEPGATWKPRAQPLLQEWLASRGKGPA